MKEGYKKTTPKPFVFVLMPLDEEFDDVYLLGIKEACDKAGAYAERVDEQIFQESILERIYNQIAKADVIIADMTGRNPNVFYETGYAHALGKNVILLTKNADDIPFDLKHYHHIVYRGKISDLIPELDKRIRWAINQAKDTLSFFEPQVHFYIEGESLENNPTINYKIDESIINLQIDVHNLSRTKNPFSFEPSIIISHAFERTRYLIKLPDGRCLLGGSYELVSPGAWTSFSFDLEIKDDFYKDGHEEEIALRIISEFGDYDYPFKIKFNIRG